MAWTVTCVVVAPNTSLTISGTPPSGGGQWQGHSDSGGSDVADLVGRRDRIVRRHPHLRRRIRWKGVVGPQHAVGGRARPGRPHRELWVTPVQPDMGERSGGRVNRCLSLGLLRLAPSRADPSDRRANTGDEAPALPPAAEEVLSRHFLVPQPLLKVSNRTD